MLTRGALRAAALVIVVLVAGCASQVPRPAPTTNRAWPTHDQGLRPVEMPYHDGLAYVFDETAAAALCGALSSGDWEMLFGKDVVRVVERGTCRVDSGPLTVHAEMTSAFPAYLTDARTEVIDGHQAWLTTQSAVAEVAPRGAGAPAKPLLSLEVSVSDPAARADEVASKLEKLLTAMLAELAHDGPATPVDGTFTPTAPVLGVPLSDLPRPVQALVLCTAMAGTAGAPAGIPAGALRPSLDGRCGVAGDPRSAMVAVHEYRPGPQQFTVAGRPAGFGDDGVLWMDLVELPAVVGTRYVELTLSWPGVLQPVVREWADRTVVQLGDL
jgi:hypothetical protein